MPSIHRSPLIASLASKGLREKGNGRASVAGCIEIDGEVSIFVWIGHMVDSEGQSHSRNLDLAQPGLLAKKKSLYLRKIPGALYNVPKLNHQSRRSYASEPVGMPDARLVEALFWSEKNSQVPPEAKLSTNSAPAIRLGQFNAEHI